MADTDEKFREIEDRLMTALDILSGFTGNPEYRFNCKAAYEEVIYALNILRSIKDY